MHRVELRQTWFKLTRVWILRGEQLYVLYCVHTVLSSIVACDLSLSLPLSLPLSDQTKVHDRKDRLDRVRINRMNNLFRMKIRNQSFAHAVFVKEKLIFRIPICHHARKCVTKKKDWK
jgi:hypothetical protein